MSALAYVSPCMERNLTVAMFGSSLNVCSGVARRVSAFAKTFAHSLSSIWQTPCVSFSLNVRSCVERNLAEAVCRLLLKRLLVSRAQIGRRRVSALAVTFVRVSSAIKQTPYFGFS